MLNWLIRVLDLIRLLRGVANGYAHALRVRRCECRVNVPRIRRRERRVNVLRVRR